MEKSTSGTVVTRLNFWENADVYKNADKRSNKIFLFITFYIKKSNNNIRGQKYINSAMGTNRFSIEWIYNAI